LSDKDDDEDGSKDNASPFPHPPGVRTPGLAPGGSVGTGGNKPVVFGPAYISWFPDQVREVDGPDKPGSETSAPAPDRNKVHFHETGDAEVDAWYAKDHEMVPRVSGGPDVASDNAWQLDDAELADLEETIRKGDESPDKGGNDPELRDIYDHLDDPPKGSDFDSGHGPGDEFGPERDDDDDIPR
jgi:hypothetical protein